MWSILKLWLYLLCCLAGVKADLSSRNSPSWLPTLHLGYQSSSSDAAKDRYVRLPARKQNTASVNIQFDDKPNVAGIVGLAGSELQAKSEGSAALVNVGLLEETSTLEETDAAAVACAEVVREGGSDEVATADGEQETGIHVQTDLKKLDLEQVLEDYNVRVAESNDRKSVFSVYDLQCYEDDESKVPFYTGLPTLAVLKLVLDFVGPHMSDMTVTLTKEQEFLLCLVKLKMNYQFQDMAYSLGVSCSTVHESFHRTLEVLVARLSFLIMWPEREVLRLTMPVCFRESFGNKFAVIVDCFEMTAEKPSGAANQIQGHSNYKHNQNVKFLIGITPQGTVSFISHSWGGRTSDKHIIEDSGILSNLLPGDILMADKGFNIEEEVLFYQVKLVIPNLTHGKKQLHPLEVENTREIVSVRINVERVIGCVRRMFAILQSTVPIEFMERKKDSTDTTIDQIVLACCCLFNLHESVVSFD